MIPVHSQDADRPSERMYKSRLHSWGLDKKKKEHEMLDLVRQGLQTQGNDRNKVFIIRGRAVTLADALHYFNRKGIKDPASLLDQNAEPSNELSSPDDADVQTPLSTAPDMLDSAVKAESDHEMIGGYTSRPVKSVPSIPLPVNTCDFAERQLHILQAALGLRELKPMPAFRTLSVESVVPAVTNSPEELRYLDAIFPRLRVTTVKSSRLATCRYLPQPGLRRRMIPKPTGSTSRYITDTLSSGMDRKRRRLRISSQPRT